MVGTEVLPLHVFLPEASEQQASMAWRLGQHSPPWGRSSLHWLEVIKARTRTSACLGLLRYLEEKDRAGEGRGTLPMLPVAGGWLHEGQFWETGAQTAPGTGELAYFLMPLGPGCASWTAGVAGTGSEG